MYNYCRIYYTLDDIRKALGGSHIETAGPYSLRLKTFNDFLNDCLWKAGFSMRQGVSESNESTICFHDYIWPRFYQEVVVYVDLDDTEDFVKKFARTKVGQIMSWWISSVDKYSLLIQNLTANKNKFLDDLKSTSISRFKDTPQNSGDFSDDQHT